MDAIKHGSWILARKETFFQLVLAVGHYRFESKKHEKIRAIQKEEIGIWSA